MSSIKGLCIIICQDPPLRDTDLAPNFFPVAGLSRKPVDDRALVEITEDATELARRFVEGGPIPMKAMADALHISVATVNGLEYLLTWNMTHIANAELRPRIERVCRASGYEPPVLCTPEELMGGQRE